jgi:hypothetical protein
MTSSAAGAAFVMAEDWAVTGGALSPSARCLYLCIKQHRNRQSGRCYPSYTTLQQAMGRPERPAARSSISRWLRELCAAGRLAWVRTQGANHYVFPDDAAFAGRLASCRALLARPRSQRTTTPDQAAERRLLLLPELPIATPDSTPQSPVTLLRESTDATPGVAKGDTNHMKVTRRKKPHDPRVDAAAAASPAGGGKTDPGHEPSPSQSPGTPSPSLRNHACALARTWYQQYGRPIDEHDRHFWMDVRAIERLIGQAGAPEEAEAYLLHRCRMRRPCHMGYALQDWRDDWRQPRRKEPQDAKDGDDHAAAGGPGGDAGFVGYLQPEVFAQVRAEYGAAAADALARLYRVS